VFKCVNGLAPKYLTDKCGAKKLIPKFYQLRSNESNFLIVPTTRLVIGSRNFAVSGPAVWNSLSVSLRPPSLAYV